MSNRHEENKTFYEVLKNRRDGELLSKRIDVIKKEARDDWLRPLGKNGYEHSEKVEKNLNRLVPDEIKEKMNSAEIFVLLVAVYTHDIGRLKMDVEHEKASYNELLENFRRYGLSHEFEAKAVAEVVYGHSLELKRKLIDIPTEFGVDGLGEQPCDLRFLAALLRIGDELDVAYTRVKGFSERDFRKLVRFIHIDSKHWIIEFQCAPSDSHEWSLLNRMVEHIKRRLREVNAVFRTHGLWYWTATMIPHESPVDPDIFGYMLKQPARQATPEEILEFYSGEKPSLEIIAAEGDIKRDQQEEIERALREVDGFRIVVITGDMCSGKKTVALRVAYQLLREGKIVLHHTSTNPQFWLRLPDLAERIIRPFYVLIYDAFLDSKFVDELRRNLKEKNIKETLPVKVIATSLPSELIRYQEDRGLKEFIKTIKLELSEREKKEFLAKLGKSYNELSQEGRQIFDEAGSFLDLGILLTKGKKFDQYVREMVEHLRKDDEILHQAYKYVCFSHSFGILIPENLLWNLDKQGKFYKLLEREKSEGVFYIDSLPSYPVRYVKARNQLIAKKTLSHPDYLQDPVKLFEEILEGVDETNWVQRRYIIVLVRAILREKPELKESIHEIVVTNEKINGIVQYGSISELSGLRTIFQQLDLSDLVEKCTKQMLSRTPISVRDCQLLISELLKMKDRDGAISVIAAWLTTHPEDVQIRTRCLSILKGGGKPQEIEFVIKEMPMWLRQHPEDTTVRAAYLAFVSAIGEKSLGRKVIRETIEDTAAWLKEHPDDTTVYAAYLSFVKKRGESEIIDKVIKETAAWLREHPDDKNIRPLYLALVRDRGFFRTEDIKETLKDAENWMLKYGYGVQTLFKDYLPFVRKVRKTNIDVNIDVELVSQLGYKYLSSVKLEDNMKVIESFAAWLAEEKLYDISEHLYTQLLGTIQKIQDPKQRNYHVREVCFGYGMSLLGRGFDPKVDVLERKRIIREAEERFRDVLKVSGGHYLARAFLAVALKEQRRDEEAKIEFERAEHRARSTDGSAGKLFYQIGRFYLALNRHTEAIPWLQNACREEPEIFSNWWALGRAKKGLAHLAEQKGKLEEAESLYTEALSSLEKALLKAIQPLQLPASKDIPDQIAQCKKHLSNIREHIFDRFKHGRS